MNKIFKKVYLLVFFIGILISLTLSYYTYTNNLEKKQIQFDSITKNIIQQIKNKMDAYRGILYSGVGLIESSSEIKQKKWHQFVKKIQLEEYFPGIQGFGYTKILNENNLNQSIEDIRNEGLSTFEIYPKGHRKLYVPVVYIEPFNQQNKKAIGYDMYSQETRRNAMNNAIITGQATLSHKLTLVLDNNEQSGFLVYTPLFKKDMEIKTKEQREKAIKGFVYTVFRTKDFIDGALGNSLNILNIKMYDGRIKNKNTLLFNSSENTKNRSDLIQSAELELDGHVWTFEMSSKDKYFYSEGNIYSFIFAFLGFLITFLITILIKKQGDFEVLKDDALFNVSQGVMITNKHHEIIYINKAFETLTGYTRELVYGIKPDFLQGKNTNLNSIKYIKNKIKELKPFECELLNYKKDGSSFWNRLSVTPILDEKNEIKHFIGIQNDITQKKELERNMLFEKNILENILSNTSAIITLINMQGVMIKLNKYGKDLVGFTQEEISSEAYFWKKFIPEDMRKDVKNFIEEAKNNNLVEKKKNSWILSNGEERIFEWSNQLIKDSTGKPEYIIAVGIDITKDVIAQKEHTKFQKQLALSAEISGLAFWEFNFKTNTFIFNDLFYSFLGTSIEKEGSYTLNIKTYFDTFVPKESQKIMMNILDLASTRNKEYQDSFEYKLIKRNNIILQVLVNYFITYDKEGKPDKAYGTKYNLTKQKEKEKILIEAKQKAENASKAKSEFLANMSHEIRTPLNGIIGLTNLMLETKLTDIQKSYLNKSIVSSEALLHVINDILDYSKIEANKLELEHIPFQLDKMLHEISNLFIYEAQNKNILLNFNINSGIPNNLIGDPFKINQILINLVANALKFTHKGTIHINVKLIEIKDDKIKLIFSVKDTGIGISKEKQKKLFKEFSQVDTSNTREYGGSGLGLVISQRLAQMMKGKIWVDSQEDKGSTFNFESILDYKKKDYKFLFQDLRNKKVLLLSTNNQMNVLINTTLKRFNLNTIICEDSYSALTIIKNDTIDYFIVEWEIEGNHNNIEFIKTINSEYKNIKVIISNSFDKQDEIIKEIKKIGISKNNLLIRPFSSSTLLDMLVNNSNVKVEEDTNKEEMSAKGKILLVEDNEINQLVAKQNLENFGLEVYTALNGKIAVEKVKNNHFDIIFMDLQMPIMDGFQASKEIRKFNSTIPIIALTAAVMSEDLQMTKNVGMNDYLSKPIYIKQLKEILTKYLKTSLHKVLNEEEINSDYNIKGINLKELLSKLNNDEELCFKMLMKFKEDKKDIIEEIDSLNIQSNKFKSLIHNLKGLSGNLCFYDVYKYTNEIYNTEILENKMTILSKLKDSLSIVMNSINNEIIPKLKMQKDKNNFSKKEIILNIKELNYDMSQGTFITQDRKELLINQISFIKNDEITKDLEEKLSNFDYESVQNILEKIIGDLA